MYASRLVRSFAEEASTGLGEERCPALPVLDRTPLFSVGRTSGLLLPPSMDHRLSFQPRDRPRMLVHLPGENSNGSRCGCRPDGDGEIGKGAAQFGDGRSVVPTRYIGALHFGPVSGLVQKIPLHDCTETFGPPRRRSLTAIHFGDGPTLVVRQDRRRAISQMVLLVPNVHRPTAHAEDHTEQRSPPALTRSGFRRALLGENHFLQLCELFGRENGFGPDHGLSLGVQDRFGTMHHHTHQGG